MAEPPRSTTCSECGKDLPPGEAVFFGEAAVCGGCRRVALQRLSQHNTAPTTNRTWREGARVVMDPMADLGTCCFKCGEPAVPPSASVTENVRPAWFWPALVGLFVASGVWRMHWLLLFGTWAALMTFAVRTVELRLPVCSLHQPRSPHVRWLLLALLVAGAVFLTLRTSVWWQFSFYALVFAVYHLLGRLLRPIHGVRVSRTHISFLGAGEPFLRTLPAWPKS